MFYSKSVGCYEGHTYDILWWGQDSAGLALVDFTQVLGTRTDNVITRNRTP